MLVGALGREGFGEHVVTEAPYRAYGSSWWMGSLRAAGVTGGGEFTVPCPPASLTLRERSLQSSKVGTVSQGQSSPESLSNSLKVTEHVSSSLG